MWAVWSGNGEATQQARRSHCSNIHQLDIMRRADMRSTRFATFRSLFAVCCVTCRVEKEPGNLSPLDCRFQSVQSGAGRWVARAWLSPLLCLVRPKLFPRRWLQLLDSFYGKAGLKSGGLLVCSSCLAGFVPAATHFGKQKKFQTVYIRNFHGTIYHAEKS